MVFIQCSQGHFRLVNVRLVDIRIAAASNAALAVTGDSGAAGGPCSISVGPAPSNNPLKLSARGRSVAESRLRTRAAAWRQRSTAISEGGKRSSLGHPGPWPASLQPRIVVLPNGPGAAADYLRVIESEQKGLSNVGPGT